MHGLMQFVCLMCRVAEAWAPFGPGHLVMAEETTTPVRQTAMPRASTPLPLDLLNPTANKPTTTRTAAGKWP